MLELKSRVEELQMENEYQLRLKEMNYNEKIKELTEKFIQQIESLTNQNQVRASGFLSLQIKHQRFHFPLCLISYPSFVMIVIVS